LKDWGCLKPKHIKMVHSTGVKLGTRQTVFQYG